MANPADSVGKGTLLGDSIQFTPAADPFSTNKVIGVIDDIQDKNPSTSTGLVHATYMAADEIGSTGYPRQFGDNKWSEWFAPQSSAKIIQRSDGTAP